MRELHGRLPLYHMDFYRLENIAEISDLGLDDYLFGEGVCVIEWANKGLTVLPEDHLLIGIDYLADNERSFVIEPQGERYIRMVEQLRELFLVRREVHTCYWQLILQPIPRAWRWRRIKVLAELTWRSKQNHTTQLLPNLNQLFKLTESNAKFLSNT